MLVRTYKGTEIAQRFLSLTPLRLHWHIRIPSTPSFLRRPGIQYLHEQNGNTRPFYCPPQHHTDDGGLVDLRLGLIVRHTSMSNKGHKQGRRERAYRKSTNFFRDLRTDLFPSHFLRLTLSHLSVFLEASLNLQVCLVPIYEKCEDSSATGNLWAYHNVMSFTLRT